MKYPTSQISQSGSLVKVTTLNSDAPDMNWFIGAFYVNLSLGTLGEEDKEKEAYRKSRLQSRFAQFRCRNSET
jgi:hypothetical protein